MFVWFILWEEMPGLFHSVFLFYLKSTLSALLPSPILMDDCRSNGYGSDLYVCRRVEAQAKSLWCELGKHRYNITVLLPGTWTESETAVHLPLTAPCFSFYTGFWRLTATQIPLLDLHFLHLLYLNQREKGNDETLVSQSKKKTSEKCEPLLQALMKSTFRTFSNIILKVQGTSC